MEPAEIIDALKSALADVKGHGVRLAIFALTKGKMRGTGGITTAGPPMTAASSAAIP